MFVNLTPHALDVRKANGTFLELLLSGMVTRRSEVGKEGMSNENC